MSIAGALLILTVSVPNGHSVSVVPAYDMADCARMREPLALTFVRKDQYEMSSNPNVWETRKGQYLYGNGSVKLECKEIP